MVKVGRRAMVCCGMPCAMRVMCGVSALSRLVRRMFSWAKDQCLVNGIIIIIVHSFRF